MYSSAHAELKGQHKFPLYYNVSPYSIQSLAQCIKSGGSTTAGDRYEYEVTISMKGLNKQKLLKCYTMARCARLHGAEYRIYYD